MSKNVINKIRAAAEKGRAQHKDSLEKARKAAEEKAAQKERDEAKKLKRDREICAEWITTRLAALVQEWAMQGKKEVRFNDLVVFGGRDERVYSETLIATCLQEAGLDVRIDRQWREAWSDPDGSYSWGAGWDITYYLVLP